MTRGWSCLGMFLAFTFFPSGMQTQVIGRKVIGDKEKRSKARLLESSTIR